jgi:tetratricopeptide (TPR) repeat protein/tRNA A-37 threonylcarbamoyl transferase component Bud32
MSALGTAPGELTADGDVTVVQGPLHAAGPTTLREDEADAEAPRFLGRYVVLDELGMGGMGQVLRAYDPQLDREVALKLLRRVTHDARARLLREAQAMAKLSHPNVLPVYDVAGQGRHLFLAMELVRGQSVRAWLDACPRAWPEVLAVFEAAGRGLAAAHAAGLVHRDFKPGNVLIGADGRVRVMDFGLARGTTSASVSLHDRRRSSDSVQELLLPAVARLLDENTSHVPDGRLRASDTHELLSSLSEDLTQMGTVVGTLSYMAPEQHLGRSADPRSDQYGFCVALWEALYGRRPFCVEENEDWYRVKSTTRPQLDPERAVPRWLHAAVLRGLAVRPSQRYASMDKLLAALTRDRRRRRVMALAVGGVLALGTAVATLHEGAAGSGLCGGAHDKLAGIWDDATATEVERAVLSTGVGYASDTWERVAPQLHDYAARWEAAHVDACEATHVRHEQPEAVMDARMRCLDERLRGLRALVGTLREADAGVVERAVSAAGALPVVELCADPQYVQAQAVPPGDPVLAAEVEALEEELARLKALVDAGRTPRVEPALRAALERAQGLGHAPLEAQARLQLGSVEEELGHYEAAEQQLEQTYFMARHAGLDTLQARAAIQLIHVLGRRMGHFDEGERWERFAWAALQRVHDPAVEAAYLNNAGLLAGDRGDHETAIIRLERALALREQLLGADHPMVASVLNNLALVHDGLGRYDAALALHERALVIRERALGPEHPHVASSLLNISNVHKTQARYAQALALQLRALAIYERAYGPEHPHTAGALVNLGTIHEALGQQERALERYTAALPLLERSQGAHHPNVAGTLLNMGNVYKALGDPTRGLDHYERALQIFEKTLGPGDFMVAVTLSNLGSLAHEQGKGDVAAAHLQRALEIVEATMGPRHPMAATIHANQALVHVARGEHEPALRLHRQALALRREVLGPRHPDTATSLQQLGEALLAAERPMEASEVLEQAVEILAEHDDQAALREDAQALLERARAATAAPGLR